MKKQMIVGMVLSVGLFSLDGMGQAVKSKVMTGSALNNVSTIVPQSSTSQAGNNSGVSVSSSTTSSSSSSGIIVGKEDRIKVDPNILKGSGSEAPAPSGQSVSPESSVVEEGGSRLLYNKPRLGGQEEVVEEKKEEIVERNNSNNQSTATRPEVSFGYNSKGELACSVLENGDPLIYKTDDLSSTPCFKLAKLKKLKMPEKTYRDDIAVLAERAPFWTAVDAPAVAKTAALPGANSNNNNGGSLLSNNQLPEAGATSTTSSGQAASNSNNDPNCVASERIGPDGTQMVSGTCVKQNLADLQTVKGNINNSNTTTSTFYGSGSNTNSFITGPSPASVVSPKVNNYKPY